jgi:hypothetical protein
MRSGLDETAVPNSTAETKFNFSNDRLKFKRTFETATGRKRGIIVISRALSSPSCGSKHEPTPRGRRGVRSALG